MRKMVNQRLKELEEENRRLKKIVADQIQRWVPGTFLSLGTDGYGRSDARKELREHFEVDRRFIAITALMAPSRVSTF